MAERSFSDPGLFAADGFDRTNEPVYGVCQRQNVCGLSDAEGVRCVGTVPELLLNVEHWR